MIGLPTQPMTWWGLPPDPVAWVALTLGALAFCLPTRLRQRLTDATTLRLVLALAVVSAALSAGYFTYYLGGAPRIIDASTYLLEAKTLATGHFSFEVPDPTVLFRGRFLLPVTGDPHRLAPIFPPGYPVLLAVGVALGDYRVIGALLAATLTAVTAWLAHEVTGDQRIVKLAALLSTVCAALRYHTADTMSHGLSIVLLCAACAIGARLIKRRQQAWAEITLGFLLGWLIATRPLTGLLGAAGIGGALLLARGLSWTGTLRLVVGASLPAAVLFAQQLAVTGEVLGSLQLAYYAHADGPTGCFGLGPGKGCRFEHGDVVARQGGDGLTWLWMLKNFFFRLHWHSLDVANLELLWPVGALWFVRERRQSVVSPLLAVLVLLPTGYALFYFQGSFPGGGARFLSELIPLLQVGVAAMAVRRGWGRQIVGLSLVGFALHGAYLHRALPAAPPTTNLIRGSDGVPQVTTDYAFNLLFDPTALGRTGRPNIMRTERDDRQLRSDRAPRPLRIEAEGDWPIVEQRSLFSYPASASDDCVSNGRGLLLGTTAGDAAHDYSLTLELTGVPEGDYQLEAIFWEADRGCVTIPLHSAHLPTHLCLTETELASLLVDGTTLLDRVSAIPVTKHHHMTKNR